MLGSCYHCFRLISNVRCSHLLWRTVISEKAMCPHLGFFERKTSLESHRGPWISQASGAKLYESNTQRCQGMTQWLINITSYISQHVQRSAFLYWFAFSYNWKLGGALFHFAQKIVPYRHHTVVGNWASAAPALTQSKPRLGVIGIFVIFILVHSYSFLLVIMRPLQHVEGSMTTNLFVWAWDAN